MGSAFFFIGHYIPDISQTCRPVGCATTTLVIIRSGSPLASGNENAEMLFSQNGG